MSAVRTNGFSWPLHLNQVLAALFFIAMFPLNIFLFLNNITAVLILDVLLSVVIVLGILVTLTDPSKPTRFIYYSKTSLVSPVSDNSPNDSAPGQPILEKRVNHDNFLDSSLPYCLVCEKVVSNQTLHCKYCNKCIHNLDHHCFYLNNCISLYNYTAYFTLLIFIFLYYVAVFYWTFGLYWVYFGVVIPVFGYTSYLVALHIYLITKGLTTLEYSRSRKRRIAPVA